MNHNVLCYGYNIVVSRNGKFQLDKALALGLDRKYWSRLQKGEIIELPEGTYTPEWYLERRAKG